MKFTMGIVLLFGLLQPLIYSIRSLQQLSQRRRKLYPLLRIRYPEGNQTLITINETVMKQSVSPQ